MSIVQKAFALGRQPFQMFSPFLFCAYHLDEFPAAGNPAAMGPSREQIRGRDIGMDFSYEDGWSMYHGERNAGFPAHPHRGFETITITLPIADGPTTGLVDHSDSLGCTARYGNGDTQWMTAGAGIQHSEMFPWLNADKPNPMALFQVWLNLPRRSKMVKPAFKMFWAEQTPKTKVGDAEVTIIAGTLAGVAPLAPPPDSYAADPAADVGIWRVVLPAGGRVTLPPAAAGAAANRAIYYVGSGDTTLAVGEPGSSGAAAVFKPRTGAKVDAAQPLTLTAGGSGAAEILVVQGVPINEPVAQHGPFVMNTQAEISQAFEDYRRTRFGGWPWKGDAPVHAADVPRHCVHPDGRRELPPGASAEKKE